MLKALDGKKSWIVAIGVGVGGIYSLATGHDVSAMVDSAFTSLGWGDELSSALTKLVAGLVPVAFAVWASVGEGRKAWQQYRAGAKPLELMTDVGHIKAAVAAGIIPPVPIKPVALAVPIEVAKPAEPCRGCGHPFSKHAPSACATVMLGELCRCRGFQV